jgi:hypothetical protein
MPSRILCKGVQQGVVKKYLLDHLTEHPIPVIIISYHDTIAIYLRPWSSFLLRPGTSLMDCNEE